MHERTHAHRNCQWGKKSTLPGTVIRWNLSLRVPNFQIDICIIHYYKRKKKKKEKSAAWTEKKRRLWLVGAVRSGHKQFYKLSSPVHWLLSE